MLKKNSSISFCVDFRDFPLTNIYALMNAYNNNKMFFIMDGFSRYNQIKMQPKMPRKLPSECLWGFFMPFGLENIWETIDVKSKAANDYISHLRLVFERCRLYPSQSFLGNLKASKSLAASPSRMMLVNSKTSQTHQTNNQSFCPITSPDCSRLAHHGKLLPTHFGAAVSLLYSNTKSIFHLFSWRGLHFVGDRLLRFFWIYGVIWKRFFFPLNIWNDFLRSWIVLILASKRITPKKE